MAGSQSPSPGPRKDNSLCNLHFFTVVFDPRPRLSSPISLNETFPIAIRDGRIVLLDENEDILGEIRTETTRLNTCISKGINYGATVSANEGHIEVEVINI